MDDKDLRTEEENSDFPEPFEEDGRESDVTNLPEERKGYRVRIRDGIKERRERAAEKRAYEDVIFKEPLTPKEAEKPKPLVRGNIDVWFLLAVTALICIGAVMSYSASAVYAEREYDNSAYFLQRYIIFAIISIAVTVPFVIYARPWFWRIFGAATYGVSILLLLLVIVIGTVGGGAQRWIAIGPITIQPSEVAKLGVIMALALFMPVHEKQICSTHKFGGNFKYGFFIPMCIIGVICALVALERHISGLMIIGIIGVFVMYLGGTRIKWLAAFLGVIAFAGVFLVLVSDYAQERMAIWWNIEAADPLGSAWQTLQSLYSIGSGGFFGLGLGASRQKFGYVSQPQNDFIFAIICEELGFVGALGIILLFCMLVWRGVKIGQRAPDKFSALVVWGITFKIALQTAMNIAVVTNTMPNTGISLPFFSSGGTAQMIQIFEAGIILSISRFSTEKK